MPPESVFPSSQTQLLKGRQVRMLKRWLSWEGATLDDKDEPRVSHLRDRVDPFAKYPMLDASALKTKLRSTVASSSIVLSLVETSPESRFASYPLLHCMFATRNVDLTPWETNVPAPDGVLTACTSSQIHSAQTQHSDHYNYRT